MQIIFKPFSGYWFGFFALFFIVIFELTILPSPINAKCPYEEYFVKGIVLKQEGINKTNPASKAKVVIYFDEEKHGFSGVSKEDGSFTIGCLFSTYSGWLFGDSCGKEPKSLTIIVDVDNDFAAERLKFTIKDIELKTEIKEIMLPTIILTWDLSWKKDNANEVPPIKKEGAE